MAFSCRIRSTLLKMAQRNSTSKRVTLHACVVLSLVILSQLVLVEGAGIQKRQSEDEEGEATVSVIMPVVEYQNTTQNTTFVGKEVENNNDKSNTGAVVAAAIIAVIVCIAIVLGVYLFKRRRQSRMMDKEKKMQIQMSSARNAGIYQDLTVSVPTDDKPSASPEQERLKAEDA
uniref:Uncharacterized protein n=1 Tax=Arion vulgaris TaxID=1028688 RepID=A0A0B6Z3U4_9EUPU